MTLQYGSITRQPMRPATLRTNISYRICLMPVSFVTFWKVQSNNKPCSVSDKKAVTITSKISPSVDDMDSAKHTYIWPTIQSSFKFKLESKGHSAPHTCYLVVAHAAKKQSFVIDQPLTLLSSLCGSHYAATFTQVFPS